MTSSEEADLTEWGIGIEDATARLAWHRSAPVWKTTMIQHNFTNPLTHDLKRFIGSIQNLSRRDGPLAGREEFQLATQGIGKLYIALNFVSVEDELDLTLERMQDFEEQLTPIWEVLKLYRRRARTRKGEMARLLERLQEGARAIVEQAKIIRTTHLVLQHHFQSQLFKVPRNKKTDNVEVAMFYDPLYRYRDSYFRKPSLETLSKYLESWRILLKEPYYNNVIISGVDPHELSQAEEKAQELALELEMELLWALSTKAVS